MFSVKKGSIPEAEESFKQAAKLAESVVDEIAKNVIQTQLAQIQKFNEGQTETTPEPPVEEIKDEEKTGRRFCKNGH